MKKTVLIIFFSIFSLLNTTVLPVVILVHGSFSSESHWHKPSGDFYTALKKSALALNQTVTSFSWSGKPVQTKIEQAGKRLAELIKSYPQSEKIILVGHSHGGNVIAAATNALSKKIKKEEVLPLISYSLYQKPQEALCPVGLYSLTTKLLNQQTHVIIQKIYLLGTPINTERYPIDFSHVEQLYNFYSEGDLVQPVGGNYARLYPKKIGKNKVSNLQITLEKSGYFASEHPTHTQLHNKEIAKWLLFIPEKLKACRIGHFHSFKNGADGKIALKQNTFPEYLKKEDPLGILKII